MRHETEIAINAVQKAIALADSREGADDVSSKGGIDLVTRTDLMCEDIIREELTQAFPDYEIVGEERGGEPVADRPYWLVDPICGTRPYASNVPLYCTNVALVEDGRVTVAAVGLGQSGETVFADNNTATCVRRNGEDYTVHADDSSNTLWVGGRGEIAANAVRDVMIARKWYIWQFSSSIAYPFLATGRISGLIHFSNHLSSVHTAAGCFVAEQAGAVVTSIDGNKWDMEDRSYLIAANKELHKELLSLLT